MPSWVLYTWGLLFNIFYTLLGSVYLRVTFYLFYTLLGSVYLRVTFNLSYTLLGSVYLRVTFKLSYTLLGSVYLRVTFNLSYTLLGSVYLRITFKFFFTFLTPQAAQALAVRWSSCAITVTAELLKKKNGQLAKMGSFHQSKRSDNKWYAV